MLYEIIFRACSPGCGGPVKVASFFRLCENLRVGYSRIGFINVDTGEIYRTFSGGFNLYFDRTIVTTI
jgi:hypothetical protein